MSEIILKTHIYMAALLLTTLSVHANAAPYDSTYFPRPTEDFLIRGANVFDGTGSQPAIADVIVKKGRIADIGTNLSAGQLTIIEATGQWLTPGIIDVHSHLGVYPSPRIPSTSDGNEATAPNTAEVWAEHSVWPQDPQFNLALEGGVTSLQILPGSANLFGGRGVTLKNVPSRTVTGMKFPGAPHGLKMACGENPKRVYGNRNIAPSTRMGNVVGYRSEWIKAHEYKRKLLKYDPNGDKPAPARDLRLETLVEVLEGKILVHNHCYRADEMATLIEISREFGYKIGTFHHAVEAYKIADFLAEEDICSAMWTDWWGFKLEAFDGIQQNVALVDQAGACAIVHSDSARDIQHLNQEASKALAAGRKMGMNIGSGQAIKWITLNAAKSLGIDAETGSIEVGKAADLVIWDLNPLSVYSRAQQVFVDGYKYYDRKDATRQPKTDFALKQLLGQD